VFWTDAVSIVRSCRGPAGNRRACRAVYSVPAGQWSAAQATQAVRLVTQGFAIALVGEILS